MKHARRTAALTVAVLAALASLIAGVVATGGHRSAALPTPATTAPALPTPTSPNPTTGPTAPRWVSLPTRVVIPAIDIDQGLSGVGLKADGAMETPAFGQIGWYDLGPRPGAVGPAVIVAHVHGPAGDDVFARLDTLRPGDTIVVRRKAGHSVFAVDTVERATKEALPVDRIWAETDQALLRLITCGGTPDPVTRMYPDNTIVYAHLVRTEPVPTGAR